MTVKELVEVCQLANTPTGAVDALDLDRHQR